MWETIRWRTAQCFRLFWLLCHWDLHFYLYAVQRKKTCYEIRKRSRRDLNPRSVAALLLSRQMPSANSTTAAYGSISYDMCLTYCNKFCIETPAFFSEIIVWIFRNYSLNSAFLGCSPIWKTRSTTESVQPSNMVLPMQYGKAILLLLYSLDRKPESAPQKLQSALASLQRWCIHIR